MALDENRKIVDIFIAYSGDMHKEIEEVKDIIARFNVGICNTFSCVLVPFYFKYQPPGAGRPQDNLNERVNGCDIFIGILGKKWGSPPLKGEYTSGFEEEFDIAYKRWQIDKKPDICIFLKEIPEEEKDDPGHQLIKILEFRYKLKSLQLVGYSTFKELYEFNKSISDALLQHLIHKFSLLIDRESRINQSIKAQKSPDEPKIEGDGKERAFESKQVLPEEVISSFNTISEDIEMVDVDERGEEYLGSKRFELGRLYLFISSLISNYHTGSTLSSHEANLIYLERVHLRPTEGELELIMRTLLANNYAPGWYWYRDMNQDVLLDKLMIYATGDSSAIIRKEVIDRFIDAEIPLDKLGKNPISFMTHIINDSAEYMRNTALKYIGLVGTSAFLDHHNTTVDKLLLDENNFKLLEIEITANYDINLALNKALDELDEIPSSLQEKFKKNSSRLTDNSILKAIYSKDDKISLLSLELMHERNILDTELLRHLCEKGSYRQKFLAIKYLLELGVLINLDEMENYLGKDDQSLYSLLLGEDIDDLIFLLYSNYDELELKSLAFLFSKYGHIAYKVLGYKFYSKYSKQIKDNLEDGFKKFESNSRDSMITELIKKSIDNTISNLKITDSAQKKVISDKIERDTLKYFPKDLSEKVSGIIISKYIQVALYAIAANGNSEDVIWGRRFINSDVNEIQIMAIEILKKFGTKDDAKLLLDVALNGTYKVSNEATKLALKLDPGVNGIAKYFFESNNPTLICLTIANLQEDNLKYFKHTMIPLLRSEHDLVRRDSYLYLAINCTPTELENILNEYVKQNSYYYDVVCWLDSILYAPKILTANLKKRIKE